MKGTIPRCMADMVEARFGAERWAAAVRTAGVSDEAAAMLCIASSDVADQDVLAVFAAVAQELGVAAKSLHHAFGEHWACTYAPTHYPAIYRRHDSVASMLLALDDVHVRMTQTIPNASPPRFEYRWADRHTLMVTYRSERNLVDIYASICRGLAKHFEERLAVRVMSPDLVRVSFAKPQPLAAVEAAE